MPAPEAPGTVAGVVGAVAGADSVVLTGQLQVTESEPCLTESPPVARAAGAGERSVAEVGTQPSVLTGLRLTGRGRGGLAGLDVGGVHGLGQHVHLPATDLQVHNTALETTNRPGLSCRLIFGGVEAPEVYRSLDIESPGVTRAPASHLLPPVNLHPAVPEFPGEKNGEPP